MTAYVQFQMEGQRYAVPVAAVVEVLHLVEITPVPDQAPDQLGVLTLRGQVIPVIDLGQRFLQRPTPLTINTPILVLQVDSAVVAFVVEAIHDVIDITANIETTNNTAIDGVVRQGDLMLILPNVHRLVQASRT